MNMFRVFMELDEAYNDRLYFIDELKKAGKNYNFDKYTDAQLYRMLQRLQTPVVKRVIKEPVHELDLDFDVKEPERCECGARLTDFGQCPVCDLGEEDLDEGIFDMPTMSSWVSASGKPVNISNVSSPNQASSQNNSIAANGKYRVRIVSDHGRLRALATDGVHPAAWVAFPSNLRDFEGQLYEVDQLIWNGKNYRVAGNIVEI
jgi:hypothetical protein